MSTQTTTIALDVDYLKSKQGLLRIGVVVIGLCGIICESYGSYYFCNQDISGFYNFVVATSLILALIILIVFSFGLDKLITCFNCFISMFIIDVLFAILYLIATILMITAINNCSINNSIHAARIFVVLFGVCGILVTSVLAILGYQVMKENPSNPRSEANYNDI